MTASVSAIARVRGTQRRLVGTVIVAALLWGAAAALLVFAIATLAERWGYAPSSQVRDLAASVLGAGAAVFVLWRARFATSRRRVALWMEERTPGLEYALVTASDPTVVGDVSALDRAIASSNLDRHMAPALFQPVINAGVAVAVAASALAAAATLSHANVGVAVHSALHRVGIETTLPNRLRVVRVRVRLPDYAGGSARTLDDPSGVTALVGSTIEVSGSGARDGIGARLGAADVRVGGGESDWHVVFTMPTSATTLSLTDRSYDRLFAVIPVADQPPTVTLLEPTRDTVWRTPPAGAITFRARATDDVGLASGYFEYTVTTGSGEVFKSRIAQFGRTALSGTDGALGGSLALAPLALQPGDILSVRAIVADRNTLSGPGTATSDTRTFRYARPDEYDSLAVEAAPPPPMEKSLLTERMLIISADSLLKRKPTLGAKEYVTSSARIGTDQADLRKRVYDILYEQDEAGAVNGVEGDDEELDPQLVINRDLKEAYDAMWDAERSLNIGEIPVALPAMNRALRALDRARLANRLYLRGRTPRIVVNVEKVRLTGKDKGASSAVAVPRTRADSVTVRLERAFDDALALTAQPQRFVDALTRLRAEAAASNATFSTALGDAVDAARRGDDMMPALVRARRALRGAPERGSAALPWSGAWPGAGTR
jgi:hypothetical protein